MKKFSFILFSLLVVAPLFAEEIKTRGAVVEGISNEHSSFAVRIDVDHANRVYAKDDLLRVTVQSSEDGYLYLLYCDASDNVSVLFPNQFNQDNFVRKNESVVVPAPGSGFRIRMDAPFGEELLKAVISKEPLTNIDNTLFFKQPATPVGLGTIKTFSKSFEKETPDWAEHQVRLQTVSSMTAPMPIVVPPIIDGSNSVPIPSPGTGQRFAVSIGISDFKDNGIPNLGICHIDAQKMMELFTKKCGVTQENAVLLTNENATLENIRKAIRERLPSITKPGDVVFIFWSGHGGRTKDEQHEFLIPYDADKNNVTETMLYDKTFGRWIQDLDGRKVLVVLDACHSGGQASQAKSLSKSFDDDTDWKPLQFAFTQLAVAKDIGQKNAALIASSNSSEVSYVRLEKDVSVLTYYLLQAMENTQQPLTHVNWCNAVKKQVADYVTQNFSGKKQTVVMQDDMTEPLVLNPE